MPAPITRIAIIGCSGSGKTTLGQRLAAGLDLPHVELDGLFHGPDWTENVDFLADVARSAQAEQWVTDGNYGRARHILWPRAQLIVALDVPWLTAVRQTVARTVRRMASGEELWNGNREHWRGLVSVHKERNIILWTATQHRRYRKEIITAMGDPRWSDTPIVRLRSRAEITVWATHFVRLQREIAT